MRIFIILVSFLLYHNYSFSQPPKQKLKEKLNRVLDKAIEEFIPDLNQINQNPTSNPNSGSTQNQRENPNKGKSQGTLLSAKTIGAQTNDGKRPELSELKDEDFVQYPFRPQVDNKNTRFKVANNLYIEIKGRYPDGYLPKWRFINESSILKFRVEDWLNPRSQAGYDDQSIWIGDYKGKAVIRFKPHFNCECFAELDIKDTATVLMEEPQTYELVNFTKILNDRASGEPCIGGLYPQKQGGKGGKITLSANENGDLKIDFTIEYYTAPEQNVKKYNKETRKYEFKEFVPSQVHYRYTANGILADNEMSAERALGIVRAEEEAKKKLKDYLARTTKQADSLQKIIAKKYPQASAIDCFFSSTGSYISTKTVDQYYVYSGDYAGSRTDWDINVKTVIENRCKSDLLFIGIKQLRDEEGGYYLTEVTKVMPAGYKYSSDQGAFAAVFTSLIGGGSEFSIKVQDKYYPSYASSGSTQWIKVIRR